MSSTALWFLLGLLIVKTEEGHMTNTSTPNWEGYEEDVTCEKGSRKCSGSSKCLGQAQWCDGIKDCPSGVDEAYDTCSDRHGLHEYFVDRHANLSLHNFPAVDTCDLTVYPPECKCYYGTRLKCVGENISTVPLNLSENITKILIQNTSISYIRPGFLNHLHNTVDLHLEWNKLSIMPGSFAGMVAVRKLYLKGNQLTSISQGMFEGLPNLSWLVLENNKIANIEEGTFGGLNLTYLFLKENELDIKKYSKLHIPFSTELLDLTQNRLTSIGRDTFRHLRKLTGLCLAQNQLRDISPDAFLSQTELQQLNLAYNHLTWLAERTFWNTTKLSNLNLNFNPLLQIPESLFHPLRMLRSLSLKGIQLDNISAGMFSSMQRLHFVYFTRFRNCKYVPMALSCEPKTDGISSFENLLDRHVFRVCIWIVAAVTCLGNIFIFTCRALMVNDESHLQSLFIRGLAASDFGIGIYLIIIASQDLAYRDQYNKHALGWMQSPACRFTGFMAMMASEASLFILTFMSVERYVVIAHPFRAKRLNMKQGVISLASLGAFGFFLAVLPLTSSRAFGEFYSSNGICLPLHITEAYMVGWQYSAFLFLGVNLTCVVLILYSYTALFCSIRRTQNSSGTNHNNSFVKRFFCIVLTDTLCWIPIMAIKVFALLEFTIDDQLYSWIAIFILPINSALNPFIYSLTANAFRHKLTETFSNCLPSRLHSGEFRRKSKSSLTSNSRQTQESSLRGSIPNSRVVQNSRSRSSEAVLVDLLSASRSKKQEVQVTVEPHEDSSDTEGEGQGCTGLKSPDDSSLPLRHQL